MTASSARSLKVLVAAAKEPRHTVLRRIKPRRAVKSLRADDDPRASAIATAIADAVSGNAPPDERSWIERIEELRGRLYASAKELEVVDYGAGSADMSLSAEQMYEGRTIATTVGERAARASQPPQWCLLLMRLVRELEPASCLELGTSVGISAAYQAAALELAGRGELVTVEGSPAVAQLARANLSELGLGRAEVRTGRFQDVLDELLHERAPVDYAFIDGHHDEQATVEYFRQLLPFLSNGAVLVFDDITWSAGMRRAWRAILDEEAVTVSADLEDVGVCVVEGTARPAVPVAASSSTEAR